MIDASEEVTTDVAEICATCMTRLRGSWYVQVELSLLSTFCSKECYLTSVQADRRARAAAVRRAVVKVLARALLVGACLIPHERPPALPRYAMVTSVAASPASVETLPPGAYGPAWPPTEESLQALLGRDAWTHPLAGPFRRMPLTGSRVFGADRPGDRPIECKNGHCGVDLGGEIWGEHVHAAHDGVIDRVQRDPNERRGGHYVRIAHEANTVFSQYFHLAAIPADIQPGVYVKAGRVIGLLGDTGVKESTAHLHFTVSVRPAKELPEKYMDPEPLVALWPVRLPQRDATHGVPTTTTAKPGVPLGSAGGGKKAKKGTAPGKSLAPGKAGKPDQGDSADKAPASDAPVPDTEDPAE
jgi:murein DD-endopeptidase MepM/ murein hydrolase activator NlpD